VSNYQRTADWLRACGKEPTAANLSVQIGCHLEEIREFLYCISVDGSVTDHMHLLQVRDSLLALSASLKRRDANAMINDRPGALDALCDAEVTGNGIAYLANFNKPAADEAVLRANEAKLVDGKPVILEGGKIGKPKGWTAPDLLPFAS
jgi:predicted HAD superfamily Cof-like phosphohydrolase